MPSMVKIKMKSDFTLSYEVEKGENGITLTLY
jgi:hypothetical protein